MAITLLASYLTFITVRALARFMVVYGRRRTALMILFGYLFGALIDLSIGGVMSFPVASELGDGTTEFRHCGLGVIGYIIRGLSAIWVERPGVGKASGGPIG